MIDLKLSEIIKLNNELEGSLNSYPKVSVKLLSNVTVSQLKPILELSLRLRQLNAKIYIGDYDNIIQESLNLGSNVIPIIIWEPINIIDSFPFEVEIMSDEEIKSFRNKMINELQLLFKNTQNSSLVIFNKFSHLLITEKQLKVSKYEQFVDDLNKYLVENVPKNYVIIDINKVIASVSINQSFDLRGFYSSKALYSADYFKSYASYILPVFLSMNSRTKKAMILDCDNTLWKGIVGEDGVHNLEYSKLSKKGLPYYEVQLIANRLSKRGIIIGLCSKNNEEDVEEVFKQKNVAIEPSVVIKKVNWQDKASNLREITKELNIGIDSLVFIDDSNFEVNLVKEKLPEVSVIQVPERINEYPKNILDQIDLFYSINDSSEDLKRLDMYKDNMKRKIEENSFENIDEYIASLEIHVDFLLNNVESIERAAQMTQKTNQFNLTTIRYTESNLISKLDSGDYDLILIDVKDKFGSLGITGLALIKKLKNQNAIRIDSLLMSCRVLGRNIEQVFINEIINKYKSTGYSKAYSKFSKTLKNQQVVEFYDKLGFELVNKADEFKEYELILKDFNTNEIDYITKEWK